jgi:cation diffusion facilitator family transporter
MDKLSKEKGTRERKSSFAVKLGMIANIFLAIIKTSIGILGHSPALLADGINSTSDVAYYMVVAVFMRLSHKPADDEHPYGHRQLESIASLVVGSFVITTAIAIFWDAINYIFDLWIGQGDFKSAQMAALYVALLTIGIKIGLTVVTQRISKQTGNAAVLALAYDHRNDIISASGAALGIFLSQLGYLWVDPLAGALVSLVILRTGVEILRQSSAELMDTVPSRALAEQVQEIVYLVPGVRQVEEVHAHRFGPYLVLNVTIGIDGYIPVVEGDDISTRVEKVLEDSIDLVQKVYVHYHPADGNLFTNTSDQLPAHIPLRNGVERSS